LQPGWTLKNPAQQASPVRCTIAFMNFSPRHILLSIWLTIVFSFFSFCKSYDAIYEKQNSLFKDNKSLFSKTIKAIEKLNLKSDTVFSALSYTEIFGTGLADTLNAFDILSIEYKAPNLFMERQVECSDVRFELGKKWYKEEFSILFLWHADCDNRSKDNYHWKLEGSEHKHSFGFGEGWFLYSDTDGDPF